MRVVAPVALLAIASLKEVANLCLVDALCHPQVDLPMREVAILVIAATSQEGPAKLRLLQVWCRPQFRFRVSIPAVRRSTFATLEEGTHLGLC
jgi:hypothetical protein